LAAARRPRRRGVKTVDELTNWLGRVRELLERPLVGSGEGAISLWSILYLAVFVVMLFWAARRLQRWLADRVLTRTKLDASARHATGTMARYVLLLIGLMVIVQTAGIDLTTFNVLAGAIGIGVGFGLQNIVSNFIAGLIIMFERPIKVGDRIEVDQVDGDVLEIGARSTTVLTNDNITIIVPNSRFITESVVNWQYEDKKVGSRSRCPSPTAATFASINRPIAGPTHEKALPVGSIRCSSIRWRRRTASRSRSCSRSCSRSATAAPSTTPG
jgi:small-conductance mechanosensitive channel